MNRLPNPAACLSLVLLALLASAGCRNEVPAYASGIVEGGRLSEGEKAEYRYDSQIRPSSARPYSRYEKGAIRSITYTLE